MTRAPKLLFGFAPLFGALACSFIVETDEIDGGCPASTKYCVGKCVSVKDATYGCTADDCAPCEDDEFGNPIGDRFVPACNDAFQCVVDKCAFGYGCEFCDRELLTDRFNCGSCMNACDLGWSCSRGSCVRDDGRIGGTGTRGMSGAGGERG